MQNAIWIKGRINRVENSKCGMILQKQLQQMQETDIRKTDLCIGKLYDCNKA